jgi:hypothetical protein
MMGKRPLSKSRVWVPWRSIADAAKWPPHAQRQPAGSSTKSTRYSIRNLYSQESAPGGNELIFLGRYDLTSSAPSDFPSTCPRARPRRHRYAVARSSARRGGYSPAGRPRNGTGVVAVQDLRHPRRQQRRHRSVEHVHAGNSKDRIGSGTPALTRTTHTVGHRRGLRQTAWSLLIMKASTPSPHDQHANRGLLTQAHLRRPFETPEFDRHIDTSTAR